MALVVLLCGAASADAAESRWCAGDGTVITVTEDGRYLMGGKEVAAYLEHLGSEDDGSDEVPGVVVYNDRFYYPCK